MVYDISACVEDYDFVLNYKYSCKTGRCQIGCRCLDRYIGHRYYHKSIKILFRKSLTKDIYLYLNTFVIL